MKLERIKLTDTINIDKWKGQVTLTVWDDRTGELIPDDCQEFDNLITTAGKTLIADALRGEESISYCGVGSGQTTPVIADTDLEAIIGVRKLITTSSRTDNIVLFSTFFSAVDNNGTWREAGLFSALTGGTMMNHALFETAFAKTNLKRCQLDWAVTIS